MSGPLRAILVGALGALPRAILYLVLAALVVGIVFPIYYMFAGSLMGPADINTFPPSLVPHGLHLENYQTVFGIIPLGQQYLNSIIMASVITIAQLTTATLAAYAFAFLRVPRKRLWFGLFLSTMMVPWEAIIIPNYLTMAEAGLINTYLALTLPFLATGFGTFLLRQSFLTFPQDLRDAAFIDGCGHLRFLAQILVPLQRPALAALGVFAFLGAWSQYFWPLLVTQSPQMQTIQIGISQLKSEDTNDPGSVMAGVVLAILPTLALVVFGQRFVVRGLFAGAVK